MPNRVIHFEIPAENPEKLIEFYQKVFDWKITKWGDQDYWLIDNGKLDEPGIGGAIYKKDWMTSVVNTMYVDDVDAHLERIKAVGGSVARQPLDIPGVGRHAVAKDPEGTLFGIIKPIPM